MTTDARVYVPHLAGAERLRALLASLAAQSLELPVLVADNGSRDGSAAVVDDFAGVELLALGRNIGFGAALMAAVAHRPANRLVFVNDDMVCPPRFTEALLDQVGGTSHVAAGVLLQGSQPALIDSAGVVVDCTLMAFDHLHGAPVASLEDAPPPLGPTGGALAVTRVAFNAVGGFDPAFFAYLEDVDLALRLQAAGYTCRLARDAQASHEGAATVGRGSTAKNGLMGFGRGYLLRRYGVLASPRLATRAIAGEAIICAGQLVRGGTVAGVTGRMRGWRAAGVATPRPIPAGMVTDMSLREALARRARRRAAAGVGRVEPPPLSRRAVDEPRAQISFGHADDAYADFTARAVALADRTPPGRRCEVGAGAAPVLCEGSLLVDRSASELAKAPAAYRTLVADAASGHLAIAGPFDLIISRMTAEHVSDPAAFHRSIRAALAPGGVALHLFPTLWWPTFVLSRLLPERLSDRIVAVLQPHRRMHTDQAKFPALYRWCRGPTERQLCRLEAAGFAVVRYTGYFGQPDYVRRLVLLRDVDRAATRRLLARPRRWLTSYALVELRAGDAVPSPGRR